MKRKEFYLHPRVPRRTIFMEQEEKVRGFSAIACWHWMQQPANASGISNLYIMICGIGIHLLHRHWSPFKKVEKQLKRLPKLPSRVLFMCLKEARANQYILL